MPGYVVRLNPGPNPSETALAEIYEPPLPGYGPRGGDIDRNGVFWASLASGHLASFDRSKCKGSLNGPNATGKHCPEGWTLHRLPGPQFRDVPDDGSAESSYYTWVDWFDTFGLGRNVPIATGNMNDSLWPSRTASSSICVCPIRSASSPNGWKGVSTMRMPAGRVGHCGRPTPPERCSTSKAARRTGRRS